MSKYVTKIDGKGPNGNIFSILGQARSYMKQLQEPSEDIKKLTERVMESNSYEDALEIIEEYFPIERD